MANGPGDRVYNNTHSAVDAELQLEDGAAGIIIDGAGSDILDLGEDQFNNVAGGAYIRGDVQVNVSALEFDTGDEDYRIRVQLSNSSTFASGIADRVILPLGDADAPRDVDQIAAPARYSIPVDNELNGVRYRYMRLWVDVAGTIASGGIQFQAWLTKQP